MRNMPSLSSPYKKGEKKRLVTDDVFSGSVITKFRPMLKELEDELNAANPREEVIREIFSNDANGAYM